MTPALVVRADAGVALGLGHVMRCLALAQALADAGGGGALFVMAGAPAAFVARAGTVTELGERPGTAADAAQTASLARGAGATWVVVDGYHFDGGYQRALVDAGMQVLAFDDHGHAGRYAAQIVLNQNLGAGEEPYADREPYTRLLLGSRYVLLQREFRAFEPDGRPVPARARRVLVTLGGSDPDNVSARVLAALAEVPGPLEVQVLIGGANPHRDALERAAAAVGHPVTLVVDVRDVPARMAWADLAVAAPGGSAWELARVGTPQISIVLADNQRPAGAALAAAGLAEVLGWHAHVGEDAIAAAVAELAQDAPRRAELATRGRELIDGRGAERVLAAMGL